MIRTRKIGNATISNIVEYVGPTHLPEATLPLFDRKVLDQEASWLVPRYYVPSMDKMVIAIQLWVVEVAGAVIVIDTGVGNRKPRSAERMNMLNTLTLAWLEAAGAKRERVTHVVLTHLHNDHVGWNTVLEDGRWVPTFPNARYLAPKIDFDFFMEDFKSNPNGLASAFPDSMLPIIDAGLLDTYPETAVIADTLHVRSARGHTPGMVSLRIGSGSEQGIFSADILHHPLQIIRPDWNTAFCILPDDAARTRAAFLAEAADSGALFMPCHFPWPGCGYVRRQGDGYIFEAEITGI
jgi:glyoxylase-like metal-dependent hydrolase (beta-lactamase superfamily II)